MTAALDPMEQKGRSAVDEVIERLRALIRERALGVGDALPSEAELCTMFGAGRGTVREAVRTLKAYGLLESRQKIGAILTSRHQSATANLLSFSMEISSDAFHDIQGFRRLTEMNLFALLAANATDADFDRMLAANAAMAAADDPVEASRHDFRFHQALVGAARMATMADVYAMLEPAIRRLMEGGKSIRPAVAAAAREHEDIVQSLKARSEIDFRYHMNRHLDAGRAFLPRQDTLSTRTNG